MAGESSLAELAAAWERLTPFVQRRLLRAHHEEVAAYDAEWAAELADEARFFRYGKQRRLELRRSMFWLARCQRTALKGAR